MTEQQLHKQICDYLKWHPDKPMFNTDMSGIRLPMGLAKKAAALRSERGFPDIVVHEARFVFHGLFLEVKKESPYKKDGTLKAGQHLKEQEEVIKKLLDRGYLAVFVWDFEETKQLIDKYLAG